MTMSKLFKDAVQKGVEVIRTMRTGNKHGIGAQETKQAITLSLLVDETKDAFKACDPFSQEIFGRTIHANFLSHMNAAHTGVTSWMQVAGMIDAACQTVDDTAAFGKPLAPPLKNLRDKASLLSEVIHDMPPHMIEFFDEHVTEPRDAVLLSLVPSLPRQELIFKLAAHKANVQHIVEPRLAGWDVFKDGPKN